MSGSSIEGVVAVLRDDRRVRLIYLFGSRARLEPREGSDIDIAILTEPTLDWDEERKLRAKIEVVGVGNVDLVVLNDAGVVLRHEVVTDGRCLWARSPRDQAEFEIRALSLFLDFQPILRLQDQYLRARVEERRGGASS